MNTQTPEETQTATSIVVAPSHEVSLHEALHITKHFASSAKRGTESAGHRLTWFTGNNKCRSIEDKALPDIAGWGIEQPDLDESGMPEDYDLHEAMQVLCEQGIAAPVVVQHFDDAGKPRYVKYWALSQASLFIVCEGVPSKSQMHNDPELRWGVAYAWPQGRSSELHFTAFVKELMEVGYSYPMRTKFSSFCTDRALVCLNAHVRVLNVADKLRAKAGEEAAVAYYAYALPITVSNKTITAGKEAGKTKEVYYPVPMIPRVVDVEYLGSMTITEDQAFILEEDGRVERTVEWSIEKSKRILAGNEASSDNGMIAMSDSEAPF